MHEWSARRTSRVVHLPARSHIIPAADAQEFKRKARLVEVEWAEDMNKRGFDGKKLLETARALIDKHGKAASAPAPARKA